MHKKEHAEQNERALAIAKASLAQNGYTKDLEEKFLDRSDFEKWDMAQEKVNQIKNTAYDAIKSEFPDMTDRRIKSAIAKALRHLRNQWRNQNV